MRIWLWENVEIDTFTTRMYVLKLTNQIKF